MTDQDIDPFGERFQVLSRGPLQLLGGSFRFESNSKELLKLVDHAYGELPAHRLARSAPRMTVALHALPQIDTPVRQRRPVRVAEGRTQPPPLQMLSGAGLLGCAAGSSATTLISPQEKRALVIVPPLMLSHPYHTRYELIEFAVFTLAVRVQGLISLHGACVGIGGRGILLMGASGAGKSTVALQCLLEGFEFLSEDSVFVQPETLRATGIANFVHVRDESLQWVESAHAAAIRRSPVIHRRSGVAKFEVDLRHGAHRLARSPLKIVAIVFLSARSDLTRPLRALGRSELLRRLKVEQGYAVSRPGWSTFWRNLRGVGAYELRRGSHPRDAAEVLRQLIG